MRLTKINYVYTYRGTTRIQGLRTNPEVEIYMPFELRRRGRGKVVVWTSEGLKVFIIHVEMEKQMFGEQMFVNSSLTMRYRKDFD